MAYYGVGGGPAEWASHQEQIRNQRTQNIINMIINLAGKQREEEWAQREWENKQGEQDWAKRYQMMGLGLREAAESRQAGREERAGEQWAKDYGLREKTYQLGRDRLAETVAARKEKVGPSDDKVAAQQLANDRKTLMFLNGQYQKSLSALEAKFRLAPTLNARTEIERQINNIKAAQGEVGRLGAELAYGPWDNDLRAKIKGLSDTTRVANLGVGGEGFFRKAMKGELPPQDIPQTAPAPTPQVAPPASDRQTGQPSLDSQAGAEILTPELLERYKKKFPKSSYDEIITKYRAKFPGKVDEAAIAAYLRGKKK